MTKQAWYSGERTRTVICSFCGQEHQRKSKEVRECRARARAGKPPLLEVVAAAPKPVTKTRRTGDPLGGNSQHHAIAKLLKGGKSARRVAKTIGVPLDVVREVEAKLR